MKFRTRVRKTMTHSVALLMLTGNVLAQDEAVEWNSMNEQQQRVLSQYAKSWDRLDVPRQKRLAAGAARWVEMSGDDRAAAQKRFRAWRDFSDDQRRNIRRNYREFQDLPREDRQRIRGRQAGVCHPSRPGGPRDGRCRERRRPPLGQDRPRHRSPRRGRDGIDTQRAAGLA